MPERLFLLDGDYGVDDAIAALYLAGQPATRILAVGTVHGNTHALRAAHNALTVLDVAGLPDVPVAVGAARPLAQPLTVAAHVHGDDGLGGAAPPPDPTGERRPVDVPAAVQLVDMVRAHPGRCTILATGPLTNLALAVLLDPGLPAAVEGVVVMGGALHAAGNVGPHTEANFGHDPEAVDLVLRAGWPVTVVGLDVTMHAWLEGAALDRLRRSGTPAARFASRILPHYLGFYREHYGRDGCPLHDESAACIAADPGLATYEVGEAAVELHDPAERGRLKLTEGDGPVRVAVTSDAAAIVGRVVDCLVGSGG